MPAAGGGGGGAGSSATLAPFVKFSSIAVPGTVRIGGASQQVNYTEDSGGRATLDSAVTDYKSGATVDATYNDAAVLTKLVLTSAEGTQITLDKSRGDLLESGPYGAAGVSENQQNAVIAISGDGTRGWEYQAFGVWSTGGGTGRGTAGAGSFGAATAPADVPTTGTGNFTGLSGGLYLDSAGTTSVVGSDMTATADFGNRSIAFATTNTRDIVSGASKSDLNLAGTLNYSAGANQFTGAVTPNAGAMTGSATGKFYGPSAIEIGGTFALTDGSSVYFGAFGGKR